MNISIVIIPTICARMSTSHPKSWSNSKQSTLWLQTLWTSFVTRVFATVDPECQTWNTDTEKFHWSDSPYSSSASLSFPSHLFLHLPLPVAVTLLLCGMSGPVCLRAASCVRSHWTFAAQEILSGTGKPHGSGLYILCMHQWFPKHVCMSCLKTWAPQDPQNGSCCVLNHHIFGSQ